MSVKSNKLSYTFKAKSSKNSQIDDVKGKYITNFPILQYGSSGDFQKAGTGGVDDHSTNQTPTHSNMCDDSLLANQICRLKIRQPKTTSNTSSLH